MSLADTASKLPRSGETWQVTRLLLPLWMEPKGGSPYRPWCVLGLRLPDWTFLQEPTPEETKPTAERVGEVLLEAAGSLGFLPGRVQVADDGLAEDLRALPGLDVEQVESLPDLDEAVDFFVRGLFDDDPGFLDGEGMTLDQVASFAEAAAAMARAEPWRHLGEIDRLQIEAPERGLARLACVLGWARPERGILFGPESSEDPWLVHYAAAWMIPAHDLHLWERHGLALAGEEDYPLVSGPTDKSPRPDSRRLAFFEAALRALAVTSEDEMDSGRWEKTVETGLGPMRMILTLPELLHPPEPDWDDDLGDLADEEWLDEALLDDAEELLVSAEDLDMNSGPAGEPPTPEAQAQRLVYRAWESMGRRRVALARQALDLWPGCADAWMLLAEHERDPERSVSLYSRAVEEAGRAIDPRLFEAEAGDIADIGEYWSGHEARPYLSARLGLAEALSQAGRRDEAVAHFQELLRLDPRDRQGVRSRLAEVMRLRERGSAP